MEGEAPHFPQGRQPDPPLLGKGVLEKVSRFVASRPLGQLPEPGREQGDVKCMDPRTDNQLGQRIEIAARDAVCP